MKEEKKDQQKLPTKSNLILRVIAGAYLLYLDYGIKDSILHGTGTRQIVFALFGLLFLATGIILLISSIRRLANGNYSDGLEIPEELESSKQAETPEEINTQDTMTTDKNIIYHKSHK